MLQVPRRTWSIILATAAVLASLPSAATALTQQAPRPLMVVEGSLERVEGQGCCTPPPPHYAGYDIGLFVLPGGDVVDTATLETINGEPVLGTPTVTVWRGPGTAALYNDLLGALAAARAGVQRDCQGVNLGEAVEWQISWYGRHGRSNTFLVSSSDKSLPECPAEVVGLVFAIDHFRYEFERDPATQFIGGGLR
jgi:hypothetical protein